MSTGHYHLWVHKPCGRLMSFSIDDRPDLNGDDCDGCTTGLFVTDKNWDFVKSVNGITGEESVLPFWS